MIALASGLETPVSNTGLFPQKLFESSVDTLTIVLRKVSSGAAAMEIKELLERQFFDCIDFDTHRPTFMMRPWDGSSRSSNKGIQLHWKAPSDEASGQLRIHLTGRAIAAAGQKDLRDCVQVLSQLYSGDCTRIDVAVDDTSRMTPMELVELAQDDRNYTGVRSHRRITSGGLDEKDGKTYYFGSKQSDLQLRVYDKQVESKGKNCSIRWELQLRRGKASKMCDIWLDVDTSEEGCVGAALSGAVAGSVDFIDRSSGAKDLSRCERLPWWEKIRGYLSTAFKLKVPAKDVTMEKKIGWLCHAVMPSMAIVKRYMGDLAFWQFVDEEVGEKEPLLSPGDIRLAEQARADDLKRLKMSAAARKLREYFPPVQLTMDSA